MKIGRGSTLKICATNEALYPFFSKMRFLDFWNHHIIIYHPEKFLSRKKILSFILAHRNLSLIKHFIQKIEILIFDIKPHESCKIEGLKLSNSHLGRYGYKSSQVLQIKL